MNIIDISKAIEKSSREIIHGKNDLPKRIKSAKNYVANIDLSDWAFTKLVATEHFDINYGSDAKPFFLNHNFRNVLDLKDEKFKQFVINRFLTWSNSIKHFELADKFHFDQTTTKRFELLIHVDQIPKSILKKDNLFEDNQERFIEGFRQQIIQENSYRNRNLISQAKKLHGTTCFICQFNFEDKYGQHGTGFIEMHHLNPIKTGKRKSKVTDLIPVCANCHRMLHKGQTTLAPEELKRIIEKNASA